MNQEAMVQNEEKKNDSYDLTPNKFYKKIWFWLIILGTIGFFITVVLFLYTNVFSTTVAYIVGALFFGVIAIGIIISYFSKKVREPTLKTFQGVDTHITAEKVLNMNTAELEETLSLVSDIPVEAIRAVCDRKIPVQTAMQFMAPDANNKTDEAKK